MRLIRRAELLARRIWYTHRLRRRLNLSHYLRSQIVRCGIKLAAFPLKTSEASVLDYRVSFLGESQFHDLFDEIFMQGDYAFETEKPEPTIFDCGSNIGMSVLFFKKLYPQAKIVGFEPDPSNFEILSRNVLQNGLSDVELHQVALADADGTMTLYRSPDTVSDVRASTVEQRNPGARIDVKSARLSSFITGEVDLLKLDVEGAEHDILCELARAGKLQKIRKMHLEYHHHIDGGLDRLSSTIGLLEAHGFGYQMQARVWNWPIERCFQDIMLYCYQKTK